MLSKKKKKYNNVKYWQLKFGWMSHTLTATQQRGGPERKPCHASTSSNIFMTSKQ